MTSRGTEIPAFPLPQATKSGERRRNNGAENIGQPISCQTEFMVCVTEIRRQRKVEC
jgi:hypothetical protein